MFQTFILFLLTGLIGGSMGAIIKYLVGEVSPIAIVLTRFVLGLLIILFFSHNISLIKKSLKNKELILGSLFFTGNVVLYAFGIQYTSLIMGQLLYVPTALIVAIIGYLFLKETINRTQVIGLILAFSGTSFLIYESLKTSDVLSFGTPLGNTLIGVAVLSWSFYTVISRKSSKEYKPKEITLFNFMGASIFTAMIFPLFKNQDSHNLSPKNPEVIIALILMALLSLLFIVFYQLLVKKTSAFTSSLILYMNPVVASFFGIIFFKERLTPNLLLGGSLIIVAVFYSTTYQYIKRNKS